MLTNRRRRQAVSQCNKDDYKPSAVKVEEETTEEKEEGETNDRLWWVECLQKCQEPRALKKNEFL